MSAAAGVSGEVYSSESAHSLGVNWVDIDNDGWVDLFAVGGAPQYPPRLFRNLGDGTFEAAHHLVPKLPATDSSAPSRSVTDGCASHTPSNRIGVHALAHSMGAAFHIPHGRANAFLLCPVFAFLYRTCTARLSSLAESLGIEGKDDRSKGRQPPGRPG